MKVPKSIDFSQINVIKFFENTSKEYKTLLSLNDDGEWKDYVNEMLSKGISVIYDASGDFFIAKPVAFKENKNRMSSKNSKKLGLKDFDFLNENDLNVSNLNYDTLNPTDETLNEESYPWDDCMKDQKKKYGSKKIATKVCGKIKSMNESDKEYLLYDDQEEDVEELPGKNVGVETPVKDLIHLDDEDTELDNEFSISTEIQPAQTDTNVNTSQLTVQDIENIVKQFLSGQNSAADQQSSSVPDNLANGQASTINQDTQSSIDVLDSEFPENQTKLSIVEDKIENDDSYLDILNGDQGQVENFEPTEIKQTFNTGGVPENNDGFEIYEEPEEEIIQEGIEDDELEINSVSNNYEDGDFDLDEPEPVIPTVPTGSTINAGGNPIKIEITGWLITVPEVTGLAESIKKQGGKLRKLQSPNNKELNLFIEANKKIYKIKYEDKSKTETQRPWSIKDKKFASLQEAVKAATKNKLISNKEKSFKSLIALDKDLNTRTLNNIKESNIFEDFRNDKNTINYVPGWNIKHVGKLDLKKGLNEVFSNITNHSKDKNTLFKTKDGKYYLIKGTLGEASKKGEKRHLVDLEGKKDYGVGQVIGIYENTYKGLGEIMYKIRETSIPLLVWKRK